MMCCYLSVHLQGQRVNVVSLRTCARWPITITHLTEVNVSVTVHQAIQSVGGCACLAAENRLTQCSSNVFSRSLADKQNGSLAPPDTADSDNSVHFGDTGLFGMFRWLKLAN